MQIHLKIFKSSQKMWLMNKDGDRMIGIFLWVQPSELKIQK